MTETERELNIYLQKREGVQAGDAIRLTKDWSIVKVGAIGIIAGTRHRSLKEGSIIFNYSAFRDDKSVSCSGGPGTITTDTKLLIPTGEKKMIRFWRWKDGYAKADNGEDYFVMVNVWEWDGTP
jgi:hypothetical protein